jgi:hypothetical protein
MYQKSVPNPMRPLSGRKKIHGAVLFSTFCNVRRLFFFLQKIATFFAPFNFSTPKHAPIVKIPLATCLSIGPLQNESNWRSVGQKLTDWQPLAYTWCFAQVNLAMAHFKTL